MTNTFIKIDVYLFFAVRHVLFRAVSNYPGFVLLNTDGNSKDTRARRTTEINNSLSLFLSNSVEPARNSDDDPNAVMPF